MDKEIFTLFIEKGCADCAPVFAELDSDKLYEAEDRGNGVELHVVLSFTNNTTEELFGLYGIKNAHTPVLLKPDGETETSSDKIIDFLKSNGFGIVD